MPREPTQRTGLVPSREVDCFRLRRRCSGGNGTAGVSCRLFKQVCIVAPHSLPLANSWNICASQPGPHPVMSTHPSALSSHAQLQVLLSPAKEVSASFGAYSTRTWINSAPFVVVGDLLDGRASVSCALVLCWSETKILRAPFAGSEMGPGFPGGGAEVILRVPGRAGGSLAIPRLWS